MLNPEGARPTAFEEKERVVEDKDVVNKFCFYDNWRSMVIKKRHK